MDEVSPAELIVRRRRLQFALLPFILCNSETNINTGKPFGTEKEIARCHPNNTKVPLREYNAAERAWFYNFARNPNISWSGPFASASNPRPVVIVGHGVFDKR